MCDRFYVPLCAVLKNHLRNLKIKEKIGEGTYSSVYAVTDTVTKQELAVKVINISNINIDRELRLYQKLKHPNLCQIKRIVHGRGFCFILMQLVKGVDLYTKLMDGKLNDFDTIDCMWQITQGVKYMHSLNIAHRDLKIENIMISDGHITIIDFGFAREHATQSETFCGTPGYLAPEILRGVPYDGRVADMYSLGVVFYCVMFQVFPNESPVRHDNPILNSIIDHTIVDLPHLRWTIDQVEEALIKIRSPLLAPPPP